MANEELKTTTEEQIFPRYPQKTYGLMEMMKGSSTIVGKGGEQDSILSWPNLIILEFLLVLASTVGLIAWSLVQNAPLTEMANPDVTENPAKAPWYFLGLQELLLHMHPSLAGVMVPTLLIVLLLALPYFDRNTRDVGIWFASRKGRVIAAFGFLYGLIWIAVLVPLDALFPIKSYMSDIVAQSLPQGILALDKEFLTQIVPGWVIPIIVMGGLIGAFMVTVKLIWKPNLREMVIAMFSAFVGVLVMLTLWSTWFRGKNMLLQSPGDVMVNGYDFLIGPAIMLGIGVILLVIVNASQKEDAPR